MRVIAVIGAKGGTGRSTVVMALTLGLLGMGRRVLVVDASHALPTYEAAPDGKPITGKDEGYEGPVRGPLEIWGASIRCMLGEQGAEPRLEVMTASGSGQVQSGIGATAEGGFDVCIYDTSGYHVPATSSAMAFAGLHLVPAREPAEAEASTMEVPTRPTIAMESLVRGVVCGAPDPAAARAGFDGMAVLDAELPRSVAGHRSLLSPVMGARGPVPVEPLAAAAAALAEEAYELVRWT